MLFVENNTGKAAFGGVRNVVGSAFAVGVRGDGGVIVILGVLVILEILENLEEYMENASVL
ncbi:hypothetical protein CTM59_07550 [Prevotella intermedia]|uniref:Uncharacterized protein n=1 Tax=Prevotella intermedia TaxID=28131 RepID=A0A2M8TJA8_PREIN|nr:hypothetical protein CTM59_07550 [Prevotella intermedia]